MNRTIKQLDCCLAQLEDSASETADTVAAMEVAERWGNVTLAGGSGTAVADTSITANSIVQLTRKTAAGTIGDLTYSLSAGVGFTAISANVLDTSVVSYHVKY